MSAHVHRYIVRLQARSTVAAVDSLAIFVTAANNEEALKLASTVLKSPTRWSPETVEKARSK